jgi:hypothetical protein
MIPNGISGPQHYLMAVLFTFDQYSCCMCFSQYFDNFEIYLRPNIGSKFKCVIFFFKNAKAKIENLAIDQAVYLLMNGDF